jgi:DNA-binding NtrC family response regulator
LVIGNGHFRTQPLPETGVLTLGQEPQCDVHLDDASVAGVHARLALSGAVLSLENLAGAGKTRAGEHWLAPGEIRPIAFNELVTVGTVMLVVQRQSSPAPRRIWSHGYFVTRLEEECLRAERLQSPFGLLRLECAPGSDVAAIEDRISKALRASDVVGAYGPGAYQILLIGAREEDAQRVRERLCVRLSEVTVARVGLAWSPRDGRTAHALTAFVAQQFHREPGARPAMGGMDRLQELVARVAASTINVLILGETGVGKEQLAHELHRLSPRADRPFLGLNGAALSETLLESELFGHERGAFTGAVQSKPGLLEAAEGGTVFLDEVGELPMSIQAKLLRVLETRQVLPVGSVRPRAIDVRFVAATNADLELEVRRGRFRQDLFFRLNGVLLVLPPLRERVDEIPKLAHLFIEDACRKFSRPRVPQLLDEALALLMRYRWPGNIRELRNVIERAVVICDGEDIGLAHLPVDRLSASFVETLPTLPAPGGDALVPVPPVPAAPAAALPGARTREQLLQELKAAERQRIVEALAACAGNQTRAAELLGISRRTMVNRLNELGISGPRRQRKPPKESGG